MKASHPISIGDLMEAVGPVGIALSLLVPVMLVGGILVIATSKETKPIKLFLAASLLPLLLGIVAGRMNQEERAALAERHEDLTLDKVNSLAVTMGVVATAPGLGLGFLGLILKSGRRAPRKRRAPDPLDG